MKSTFALKAKDISQNWHQIDASGKLLGDLATDIAILLLGKNKPTFSPHMVMGDKVVVTNIEGLQVTGKKLQDKVYYKHTGYPGGVRQETLAKKFEKKPDEVLRLAVKGMLPKNKLQKVRLANLYIYKGNEHPHKAHIKQNA